MAATRNQHRFNNQVAYLVTTARTLGVDAQAAADYLGKRFTQAEVAKAAERLAEPPAPQPADPFAGLPRF